MNHPRLIYDVVRTMKADKSGGKKDTGAAGFEDCEKVSHAWRVVLLLYMQQSTWQAVHGRACRLLLPSTLSRLQFFPDNFHRERSACVDMSGKFALAARMLTMLRHTTDDRIVIVSCYTQTLDLFTALCRENVSAAGTVADACVAAAKSLAANTSALVPAGACAVLAVHPP